MAKFAFARLVVVGGIVAALACARNPQDETGAAPRDTVRNDGMVKRDTAQRDTTGVYAPTPSRDTTMGRDTTMKRDTTRRDTTQYRQMRDSAEMQMQKDTSSSTTTTPPK